MGRLPVTLPVGPSPVGDCGAVVMHTVRYHSDDVVFNVFPLCAVTLHHQEPVVNVTDNCGVFVVGFSVHDVVFDCLTSTVNHFELEMSSHSSPKSKALGPQTSKIVDANCSVPFEGDSNSGT